MDSIQIGKAKSLKGAITVPSDKSISHRAIMFASLANGKSLVRNPLMAEDPISTMNAFRAMGVEITEVGSENSKPQIKNYELIINGRGLYGLKEPFDVINCGNSGTTVRLLSGILAGNPFFTTLTGDDSLKQRPMARVINPLKEMGANIFARNSDKCLPMAIKGGGLKGINYKMPMSSAQVKSCLILAGLYAEGETVITEDHKSRDHTERMLNAMGADIKGDGLIIKVRGGKSGVGDLKPIDITVPSDFSSAAFFIAAALLVPDSELLIKNVGINPTRTGMLEVIKEMGAAVSLENMREISGEPVADIYCKAVKGLKAIKISGEIIPSLIDEFPILCILASQAEGVTEIRDAGELRVKESDRIKAMATELSKMGVEIEEYPDGMAIRGRADLKGAVIESHHDHRIAMAFAIAALLSEGATTINNPFCVDISFPGFFEELKRITS
ncbi:MAG: 3-phosphoshikimate 1-carboxyvinyltransferase [Nitrospirae bacterium]|nr:3-phosphoshikimate 1-carboxyvinyltransferase [Nitrospirota bacterium]